MEKLINGIARFQSSSYEQRKKLFAELANGQSPEVLFITCSDSRIDPNLLTQTEPGDLFIIRNAGNIVPPHMRTAGGVTASIEFAVMALGVEHIVVCGHSDCGAMKGALNPSALTDLPHVQSWLDHARGAVEYVRAKTGQIDSRSVEDVTRENVKLQLQHLRTHPAVLSRLATGQLELHGWVYDIKHGTIDAYSEDSDTFVPVNERYQQFLKSA
ncbi:MAG: carbonic anhydrase [Gammaproteobacteria bacterium]|nr:carbonic anhydrase [Pseudomonadales bacterium]MCP5349168.1 carbonic anhydrase [Pseudomonadales bacterium]